MAYFRRFKMHGENFVVNYLKAGCVSGNNHKAMRRFNKTLYLYLNLV